MEKADIWMPFYVADYLADTMHLTAAEHGGYLMLICHYWKTGPIPDNDARLATISRLGDAWSNASSTLRAFFEHKDGMLVHRRIDKEKANAACNKDKNKARAQAAAAKRWGNNAPSNATSITQALLNECPSPSPSSFKEKNIVPSVAGDLFPASEKPAKHDCPHQEIIAIYHEILPQCPRVRDWTPARAVKLRARWNEDEKRQDLDWWREFLGYVASCDFLVGKSEKPFFASLEWIVTSSNFVKIREGNYENRQP